MAQFPTVFYVGTAPNGTTTLYTAGTKGRVDYCNIYNNTVTYIQFTLSISGQVIVKKVIAPAEAYTCPEAINAQFSAADTIVMTTNNVGLNVQISGYLFT